ncbi:MAG: hypothetical protein EA427_12455 [Spirochaetaceae bacterium]|nr:MAG: hypothetical protein EA427_12455 [Spirochaetaceae bacterium]
MIDVMQLLRERNPSLAARLPRGAGSILRLVAHEGKINRTLARAKRLEARPGDARPGDARYRNAGYRHTRQRNARECDLERVRLFCDHVLSDLGISLRTEQEEYLREATRPVVCANHPTGGVEGLALISTILRVRGTCRVPANDLLNLVSPLIPVILPVNRARPAGEHARALLEAFHGTDPILVFPAGVTARVEGGVLRERPWESAFVTRARRTGREIVPVRVSGRNSDRFYRIHRVRRALRIGFNLEMALLVDELFRRRGETVVLRFLPPRGVNARGTRSDDRRQAAAIRREVERAERGMEGQG